MAVSGKWIDGIGPETSVDDAARRSLELRLAVIAHSLPLAAHLAEHDIEHVHRLRVATRRAAAALKLYRDWAPRKPARWMKKRLRKIRRAAGDARDLDVLIERVRRESSANTEPMLRFLADKRRAAQPNIISLADDLRRDDRFIFKAAQLLSKIAHRNASDEPPPSHYFGEWAPQKLATVRSAFVDLLPTTDDDIAELHEFRIRAKALRYAIELLAPAFDLQLRKEIYPAVEELQERLGKITDHIAAMNLFAEWRSHQAEQASLGDAHDFLELEKQQQAEDLQNFRQWWTPDRANWLKDSLAEHAGAGCG